MFDFSLDAQRMSLLDLLMSHQVYPRRRKRSDPSQVEDDEMCDAVRGVVGEQSDEEMVDVGLDSACVEQANYL